LRSQQCQTTRGSRPYLPQVAAGGGDSEVVLHVPALRASDAAEQVRKSGLPVRVCNLDFLVLLTHRFTGHRTLTDA
jgi:hypothetical protein